MRTKKKKNTFIKNGVKLTNWLIEEAKYEEHLDWVKSELETQKQLEEEYERDRQGHWEH